ncbi:hypothetical protein OAN307_c33070 [Octadecabacter antarcticus 307]|uniref:Phytanoyl-CoA dioxygenase n=1 Tax=Octadecabacter antarcticus 307 TaxID=391626 RepID=M9R9D0_9RHOB|nr:hypothetical protein [Octadecabacter antarcticus]AGI68817.1 hypothetical protein OAN307_c33070 [Octadecabacter antarcticus 307]
MADLATDGFVVFDADPRVTRWATCARVAACDVSNDPVQRAKWLRHGETWFVGVDALPNGVDGSIGDVDLSGPWDDIVTAPNTWHRAQVSVVYEGYPKRDPLESEAAHWFRIYRCSAHVDGLHLEAGRRIVREPHAFVLGLPLNESDACPLVVWRGSHLPMRAALADAVGSGDPRGVDVTECYIAARGAVFDTCEAVEVPLRVGQAVLVDRFAVHGVAPWRSGMTVPADGRMIAYFRPEFDDPKDWILG